MKKFTKDTSGTLFLNMIFPYACVLLVPMLVWIGTNMYVTSNNEKRVVSLVTSNIENNVSVVDSALSQIENSVMSLSQNSAFDSFFEKKTLTYEEKTNYQKLLSSYYIENGTIQEFYLYSNASKTLIDQNSIYNSAELFFRHKCGFDEALYKEWAAVTENMSYNNGYMIGEFIMKAEKEKADVLPYIRTIPIEYPSKKQGMVGVLIDKNMLLKSFGNLSSDGNVQVYVYTSKGESVMSHGKGHTAELFNEKNENGHKRIKLDGKKLHQFTYVSPKTGWQYNVIIADNSELRDIVAVNNALNIINFVTFLIGLLLCIYLTWGRHKSYVNIMDALGSKHEGFSLKRIKKNEFDVLKPYVESILEESSSIKKSMEKLHSTDSHRVLHLLLNNSQSSEETIREMCKEGGLNFNGEKFLVMVLKSSALYNIDAINNKNMFLRHIIKEYLADDFYLYIADAKTTAVIISHDMDEVEAAIQLRNKIAKMNLEVFYRYHSEFIIGVSESTDRLAKLSDAFSQAMEVISYNALTSSKNTLFYSELPKEHTMYYYPIDLENRFINAISSGKVDEALKIIDTIYENNFVKATLTASRIEELFQELSSSLNKIRQMYFADEERLSYQISDFTIKSFFEYLKDFVFSACENMSVFDENANNARFKEMLEYINENYNDNMLSLTSLANEFGFSDITYISKSFKKYMNENFSSYLERIRIEKACEMLRADMQVKEVSEKAGYLSDVSFRRAFKKRMGMSPSDYVKDSNRKTDV